MCGAPSIAFFFVNLLYVYLVQLPNISLNLLLFLYYYYYYYYYCRRFMNSVNSLFVKC